MCENVFLSITRGDKTVVLDNDLRWDGWGKQARGPKIANDVLIRISKQGQEVLLDGNLDWAGFTARPLLHDKAETPPADSV